MTNMLRRPTVAESMSLGYEAFAPEQEQQVEPTGLDVAAATLRAENPVSAWVDNLNYRSEQEDVEAYDPYEDIDDKYLPYSKDFLDVRSPDQRLMKEAQIDNQLRDREVMAKGGLKTIGWSLVAGLGDPINLPLMLLPASIAVRAGAGVARTAAVTATGGAVEAGLSEALLHSQQPVRTWEETMFAMGGTVLLGGTLGGLAGLGTKRTMNALSQADKDIKSIVDDGGMIDLDKIDLDVTGTAGAQRVLGTLEEEGTGRLGPGVNPLIRTLKSPVASARSTVNRMLRHNFFTGGNKANRSNPTSVETEIVRTQQGMGARYLRTLAEGHKAMRKTGIKMKAVEFNRRVGRAMRRGDVDEIPEIAAAARKIRSEVINPITKGFQDLGDLPEDLSTKYAKSYLPRVYDTKAIKNNMDRWLELLTVHFTGKDTSVIDARALARDITDKILGSPNGRLPQDIVGSAGSLKERVLNIRDEVLDEGGFLNDNVDEVMQTYLRSTAPELHLKQEFGDHELAGEFGAIRDEYDILIDAAKNNKERKRLGEELDANIRDLTAMRDIMLGRYLPTSDAGKTMANAGRVVRGLSFMANLGMMTISAIPDLARPIMQHGAASWAKALPRSMLYWGKRTKMARRQMEEMGIGVDTLMNSRAYALADIDEVGTGLEKFTRGFAKLSGMNHWNGVMKKVAGFTAQNRFINDSINFAKLSAKRKERLAKAGSAHPGQQTQQIGQTEKQQTYLSVYY
jgi:hypothetical protein